MNKAEAEKLIELLMKTSAPLDEAAELVDTFDSELETRRYRRKIGNVIADIYIELILEVCREYPELNPVKD